MYLRRTTGIVLKVTDYGDSDKIVTFLCLEVGKLTVIAKGAKRSKKRFVNKLELFSHLDIQYNNRYRIPIIDQAELLNSFPTLRHDYKKYTATSLICEQLTNWSLRNNSDDRIYHSALMTMSAIDNGQDTGKSLVLFFVKLFSLLGYQPNFNGCAKCSCFDSTGSPYQFNVSSGTILCRKCAKGMKTAPLLLTTLKLLANAQKFPLAKAPRLQFSHKAIKQSLFVFQKYGNYLLDREIQSWRFLI